MREILFRGKSVETGLWVYGSLVNNLWLYSELTDRKGQSVCEIITGKYNGDCWEDVAQDENCIVSVIPESVGQYTGKDDKKGVKIFENDIVRSTVLLGDETINGIVKFTERGMWEVIEINPEYSETEYLFELVAPKWPHRTEVIGNSTDNSEMC